MRIGRYDVHSIDTGRFALDGGAMFGVVPRPLWQKTNPPDEKNRICMAARALLILGENRRILVDTGNGVKYSEKQTAIYRFEAPPGAAEAALARYGLSPGDITDVILTHLHFDHAGGSTLPSPSGIVPAFPNARYVVQRDHWNAALHPSERDRASFFPDDYMPLRREGLLELIDGEGELFPGIVVRLFHGHTTALQAPLISGGGSTLLFCADLIPMVPHVQLPWIMGYDLRPLVTLEEKRAVLTAAADEGWILALEHDPQAEAVTVVRGERGFGVDRTLSLD